MTKDFTCIISKILIVILLLVLFWQLSKYYASTSSQENASQENFENINYLKLKETYIEPDETNLDMLYSSYTGDESGDTWTNKTLDQCIDTCNQLDKCIGFSRDLVNTFLTFDLTKELYLIAFCICIASPLRLL